MVRQLTSLVLGLVGLAGCSVDGTEAMAPPDTGDDPILCTATVTLTGTFTAPVALDPTGGCQPEGTWAVNVAVSDRGTCSTVSVKPSYNYTLSGVGHSTTVTYTGSGGEFQGNVSATGDGACSGFFEHIQTDGTNFDHISLHPLVPKPTASVTQLTISGTGDFELWKRHP
jgi:hypothetical protein